MPILSSVAFATAKAYGFGSPDLFAGAALSLAFDETTTLDSRITFTRATNGTYFDSAGVLQTASSGVARFDHRLEGGVWVNKGLLIEEQRTNVLQRSEEFNDAYWTKGTGTAAVDVTANSGTAPDGTTTADSLIPPVGATNGPAVLRGSISITANTNYTLSLFVQSISGYNVRIQFNNSNYTNGFYCDFDLGAVSKTEVSFGSGSVLGSTITDVGGGFYRVTVTGKVDTTTTTNCITSIYVLNGSMQFSYTPNGTSGIRAWGAQLELGTFPTSYIKTTNASATRNADVASMTSTNFSDWYNQTEGTVFTQVNNFVDPKLEPTFNAFLQHSISNNTANERIQISNEYSNPNNIVSMFVSDGGVTQVLINNNVTYSSTISYKTAYAVKANDFGISVNGSSVSIDTSGTMPTPDRLYFGTLFDGSALFLNGCIAKFYYWNTRKPNSFLQTVTG